MNHEDSIYSPSMPTARFNTLGRDIALADFADTLRLGLPRVKYFPKNEPSQRWRLTLMGLTLPENPGESAYGWGEELEDAYRDFICRIKGRWVRVYGEDHLVPKGLTIQ